MNTKKTSMAEPGEERIWLVWWTLWHPNNETTFARHNTCLLLRPNLSQSEMCCALGITIKGECGLCNVKGSELKLNQSNGCPSSPVSMCSSCYKCKAPVCISLACVNNVQQARWKYNNNLKCISCCIPVRVSLLVCC